MKPEDFDKAKKLIAESTVLSSLEKTEWTQMLIKMNDHQLAELIDILTPPASVAPKLTPKPLTTPPWELSVNPKEKELTTSKSTFEPELAAPAGPAAPHIAPSPRSPEELQKLVEQIANHKPATGVVPAPPTPVPPPPVKPAPAGQVILSAFKEKEKRVHSIDDGDDAQSPEHLAALLKDGHLDANHDGLSDHTPTAPLVPLREVDDFTKLTASMLHGKDPVAILQEILNAMAAVSQKVHSFQVVASFQKSSLNKTYVEFGLALLNDPNADRNIAFDNVSRTFKARGKDFMTKQEFEVFTDFRNQIDKLFL